MATILVTGGTGYIGSHTAVELMEAGMDVVIVDNLENSRRDVVDGITEIAGKAPVFVEADLRDKEAVMQLFEGNPDIQAVIHFAAYKAVGESVEKPLMYYENNLHSLTNILEAMEKHEVQHIVFSSSCTVYGQPEKIPVSEEAPIQVANSPYGNTKQICEEILRDTVHSGASTRVVSLRYFNPIGAHPSALIGELPLGVPANLVPFITQTAIGLREQLSVFGDDYNTPDGSAIRDYIYVVDLARAHVVAIQRLLDGKQKESFEIFNLGTGKGVSVLEMLKAFEKATGEKVNYKVVERRDGDVEQVWADTRFANDELGWKAEAGLEDTLQSAWKWEQYIRNKEKS